MTTPPMLQPPLNAEQIRALFTKPYGTPGPTAAQWKAVYADDVHFTVTYRDGEQRGVVAEGGTTVTELQERARPAGLGVAALGEGAVRPELIVVELGQGVSVGLRCEWE